MPTLVIDTASIRRNADKLCAYCRARGIGLALVTKGICADAGIVRAIADADADFLADSRLRNIARYPDTVLPKLLLRLPSLSEAAQVVKLCDASLNAEIDTMKALDEAARAQGRVHGVILMVDLGDLREGIYYKEQKELVTAACFVRACANLKLLGIGTNLTCFASILPTSQNLGELTALAALLERELDCGPLLVSGGNSSSLYLLPRGDMPKGINNLRLGEAFLRGVEAAYMEPFLGLEADAIQLEAELIEVRQKPSAPSGSPGVTTWGETPVFADCGDMLRGIVALGRQDADIAGLEPVDPDVAVLGASSDHTLLDLTACASRYKLGDRIRFNLQYPAMLRAFTSAYVEREYR